MAVMSFSKNITVQLFALQICGYERIDNRLVDRLSHMYHRGQLDKFSVLSFICKVLLNPHAACLFRSFLA